jgi:hypothetical protein
MASCFIFRHLNFCVDFCGFNDPYAIRVPPIRRFAASQAGATRAVGEPFNDWATPLVGSGEEDQMNRPKTDSPFADDRKRNPDIGQSKGSFATGEDPELIEGENTVEGDVENDSTYGDGADPDQLGRTNK